MSGHRIVQPRHRTSTEPVSSEGIPVGPPLNDFRTIFTNMSDHDTIPDDAYEALEGLCEDPAEHVEALARQTPEDAELAAQETVFKALGNEKRLRILAALRESERCVCELQAILQAPQSTVASHLRTLKDAGLVASRKSGKWRHYRIADTAAIDLLDLAAAVDTGE